MVEKQQIRKILIYGIGSLQNKGCEALVNSTIAQFNPAIDIVAATFDYEHDKNMYKDRIKYFVNHHKQKEEEFTEEEKKNMSTFKMFLLIIITMNVFMKEM